MTPLCVAIYARVSSEQQATSNTIDSQIAALEARLAQDGLTLVPEGRFIDEGYSGATLVRPALERLRDAVAAGNLDRLYVHSPDRLARRYAYQVLLIDEFHRAGVEIIFLNRPIGLSPEDDLLLQVQGMVAEYERAKILERSRRGKRHAARQGAVSVLSGAPYGYRYVGKQTAVWPATRSWRTKLGSCGGSSRGSAASASASARCAGVSSRRASGPAAASRPGIGPPCGAFSGTPPMLERRPSARPGSDLSAR